MSFPNTRLRRLRYNPAIREMVEDTDLKTEDFIYPIFVCDGKNIKNEIRSMPDQFQYSIDRLPEILEKVILCGVKSIILFGVPEQKDENGDISLHLKYIDHDQFHPL